MKFWSTTAGLDDAASVRVATMLEAAAFDGIICVDHADPRGCSSELPTPCIGSGIRSWVRIEAMADETNWLNFANTIRLPCPANTLSSIAGEVASAAVYAQGRLALTVDTAAEWNQSGSLECAPDTELARIDEMTSAVRRSWRDGQQGCGGRPTGVAAYQIRAHPAVALPVLGSGESPAHLRRAALRCDGWVGGPYSLEEVLGYADTLTGLRIDHGRIDQPFEIMVSFREAPSAELYKRAEDWGVTAAIWSPWDVAESKSLERCRASIEWFADQFIRAAN